MAESVDHHFVRLSLKRSVLGMIVFVVISCMVIAMMAVIVTVCLVMIGCSMLLIMGRRRGGLSGRCRTAR